MENFKIRVNNEVESKEVQKFLFELGYDYYFGGKTICNTNLRLVTANEDGLMANIELEGFDYKEITINQLRDMVVLKRNSIDDATHTGRSGSQYYLGVESYFWDGIKWEQRDFLNLGYLKTIEKEGNMENYKFLVNNWDESKEVQELFIALGATCGVEEITSKWVCLYNGQITFYDLLPNVDFKQITLQHLRDLVVLKRNDMGDATHYYGVSKYYLTDSEFYQYSEGKWVNIDEYVDGMTFKKIGKDGELKMKEYLVKNMYGEYKLTDHHSGFSVEDLIEVPEGAEIAIESSGKPYFLKLNGETYDEFFCFEWCLGTLTKHSLRKYKRILWERNPEVHNTSTQDKLKFIEKWLNGDKIQYILGIESEKTQADKSKWHNFTEGAMQYIKRSDIKFREAPKYVTINGIEFKSVEKLLKYVKNNFDLEGEELE